MTTESADGADSVGDSASDPEPTSTSVSPAYPATSAKSPDIRSRARELVSAVVAPRPRTAHISEAHGHRAGYAGGWGEWMGREQESDRGPADLIRLPGGPPGTRRPSRRAFTVAAGLTVVLLAGVAIAALAGSGGGDRGNGGRAAEAGSAGTVQTSGVPGCADQNAGAVVTGTGPGGTDSGPDAILWFQHSYYVERAAARARQVVGPNADVPSRTDIQQGIDALPRGTAYCARITAIADGRYSVALTQLAPGQAEQQFKEVVTTTAIGGRTVITGIASG